MNEIWNAAIVRSIQKAFKAAWANTACRAVRVYYGGEKVDAQRYPERVEVSVNGPKWTRSRANLRFADLTVGVNCFCPQTSTTHRISDIAGAVASVLDRMTIVVKDYPAASPTQIGWCRLKDAETNETAEPLDAGETPVMHANVSIDGTVEIS